MDFPDDDNTKVLRLMGEFETYISKDIEDRKNKESETYISAENIARLERDLEFLKSEYQLVQIENDKKIKQLHLDKELELNKISEKNQNLMSLLKEDQLYKLHLETENLSMKKQINICNKEICELQKDKLELHSKYCKVEEERSSSIKDLEKVITRQEEILQTYKEEIMEVRDQLHYNIKRASDSSSLRRLLEDYRMQAVTAQEKIKEMEKNVLLSETKSSVMSVMEDHLLKISHLEKENIKLKSDNAFLKSNTKNVMVLSDQLEVFKRKLNNAEEKLQEFSKYNSLSKADSDSSKTKILRFSTNPTMDGSKEVAENISSNFYWQELDVEEDEDTNIDFEKKIQAAEQKNKRLKEVFATTVKEFREITYCLTGYRINKPSKNQYRILPIYTNDLNEFLDFQCTSSGQMQLMENNFSSSLYDLIEIYLGQHDCIPAFLSAVTLKLFNQNFLVKKKDCFNNIQSNVLAIFNNSGI